MNLDKEMRELLVNYTIESTELLQEMEDGLIELESIDEPDETINAIFRAAHTIKGGAGIFGFEHIVRFTHVIESVLDELRDGKLAVSPELVAALLPCCDHLGILIREIADGHLQENPELGELSETILATLQDYLDGSVGTAPAENGKRDLVKDAAATHAFCLVHNNERGIVENGTWHLLLQFNVNCLRDGMDPLSFIRYLTTFGEIVELTTFTHALPEAADMDPESNYLGFEVILKSEATKADIESVFDFIRAGSQIHILPLKNKIDDYIELIHSMDEDDACLLGELLVKSGAITHRELDEGLKAQRAANDDSTHLGEILIKQQAVPPPVVNVALEKQQRIKDNKARETQSIRVDAERLDKLIDLIGELVIAGAAANLRASQVGDLALQEANAAVIGLVEDVRDSALQLRMVPIGSTFGRFQRVVRDVSKELGKDIRLVISGAETEVDKSVVEKIGDPLMHLVRNAMDHGIERAELRTERGKPVQGTLYLNAYHSSGSIVIEVGDDGGGLDRDRIFAKAVERGLVQPGDMLSDQDIYALIFEPGFSTAEQISNLSGRGVGMDVVKRNITELRGDIHIDSTPGQGTTLRIYLPLTLAIIDGFLVGVGESSYVIPLDRVVECVELTADDDHDYMELRGEVLPFIRLRQLFNKKGAASKRQNVIVVEHLGLKAGLVVDKLKGELQTVIKPLGKLFGHVQGVGGSTILGSGEVALIIDVPTLLRQQELAVSAH